MDIGVRLFFKETFSVLYCFGEFIRNGEGISADSGDAEKDAGDGAGKI